METRIMRIGNSTGIVLPKEVLNSFGLVVGDSLDWEFDIANRRFNVFLVKGAENKEAVKDGGKRQAEGGKRK